MGSRWGGLVRDGAHGAILGGLQLRWIELTRRSIVLSHVAFVGMSIWSIIIQRSIYVLSCDMLRRISDADGGCSSKWVFQ
jgi:hypothetical protein